MKADSYDVPRAQRRAPSRANGWPEAPGSVAPARKLPDRFILVRFFGTDMATKRVQLFVRGRVQGVFFRAAAQREARRLGVSGWVKNRNDGSIEVVAEGEEDAIKEIISWAQHGPSAARVEQVDVRWKGYTGEFAEFRIVD